MNIEDVWAQIERNPTCMLVDVDGGRLRARPMMAIPEQDAETVWFITDEKSAKDDEISRNPMVCLTFSDSSQRTHLSVSGQASVVRDPAKLRDLWSPAMEAYFPDGPGDPSALLLKVTPSHAELWQADGTLSRTFKMAKAMVTKERPDLGENAKFRM